MYLYFLAVHIPILYINNMTSQYYLNIIVEKFGVFLGEFERPNVTGFIAQKIYFLKMYLSLLNDQYIIFISNYH